MTPGNFAEIVEGCILDLETKERVQGGRSKGEPLPKQPRTAVPALLGHSVTEPAGGRTEEPPNMKGNPICYYHSKPKGCFFGDQCLFVHVDGDRDQVPTGCTAVLAKNKG